MNVKNNKKYKNNSEKIESAFLALILNHNYDDINISQICQVAEINRSTFYAHYDDINDLIITIEGKFANSMAKIFAFGKKYDNHAFIEMFQFVKNNQYFYKAFLNIPYITFAESDIRKKILGQLKDKGTYSQLDDVAIFYRANFFGAGIKEVCRIWLDHGCKESPEEMAKIILEEYSGREQ